MDLEKRIQALVKWGYYLHSESEEMDEVIRQAYYHNKWFTEANTKKALAAIADHFLKEEKLRQWVKPYGDLNPSTPKTIGLVMAGNLPLVGFHDLLSILISGHKAQVKLSSRDSILLPQLFKVLAGIDAALAARVSVVERLTGFDAVIATGGNNSARYFEHYFGKYPHIIRKNRNSVAILSGDESEEELKELGKDVFDYFGLGCRSVSKIYVPKGFDFPHLLDAWADFQFLMDYDKYKNNYDYQRTLLLMNKTPHFASDYVMLKESADVASPISCLFYEFYDDAQELNKQLGEKQGALQCVVTKGGGEGKVKFGQSQQPELWDYADHVDTIQFLKSL